jgi:hypothetical protein
MLHKHHIIPKYMGGSDDPSNLIELTPEQHAEAHKKLYDEHGNWQDYLAWQGLSKRMLSEDVAREASRIANTGKDMSLETRRKISEAKLGKKHTSEHIENNRKAQSGKLLSDEHKEKIAAALTGRTLSEEHKLNVGAKMKGRVMNEEWRKKLSESAKRRHARSKQTI